MIQIDDKLVSEELFAKRFVCDLSACKGACCVEGESGAPLDPKEAKEIDRLLPEILPYMNDDGRRAVAEFGTNTVDLDDELVTTLVDGVAECAFTVFDKKGIAKCSIEMAWKDGKIPFRKPTSCHLYPIRTSKLRHHTALNYHHWPICAPACECGSKLDVPTYRFLKEAIIRAWGEDFYQQMDEAYVIWSTQGDR